MSDDFKFKVGDKVVRSAFPDVWVEILYVGRDRFFCRNHMGIEGDYSKSSDWQLYTEPKKTKLVSPSVVIANQPIKGFGIQETRVHLPAQARVVLKNLRWIDKDCKPVGSDENQLEGDLFFIVEAE